MLDLLLVIFIACILDALGFIHIGKFSNLVVGCAAGYILFLCLTVFVKSIVKLRR